MILFISDIHLGYYSRQQDIEIENRFIKFLQSVPDNCQKLFIVGDLFDYWFEYKSVIPKYFIRTLAEIYNLRKRGIEIEYLMGNHDFGHIDFFEKELGIPVIKDDIERTFSGKKFYISHGDGKSDKDLGYKILKKILRSPLSMRLFQILHPDFGIGIARHSSQQSRKHTDTKHYGNEDAMKLFSREKIKQGFDYVVMGHRHKAEIINYGNGYYINLGAWLKTPTYGIFENNQFKLIEFK